MRIAYIHRVEPSASQSLQRRKKFTTKPAQACNLIIFLLASGGYVQTQVHTVFSDVVIKLLVRESWKADSVGGTLEA